MNLSPGVEKWYVSDAETSPNMEHRLHVSNGSVLGPELVRTETLYTGDQVFSTVQRRFTVASNGDIYFLGIVGEPGINRPTLWVDAPLRVGKEWSGERSEPYGDSLTPVQYDFECLGMETISCPLGDLPCFQVQLRRKFSDDDVRVCTFWYNRTCGMIGCCLEDGVPMQLIKVSECPNVIAPAPGTVEEEYVVAHRNAPNPFNPQTAIQFTLSVATPVDVAVYDVSGRLVRRLLDGTPLSAGHHSVAWGGCDQNGRSVAAGTYLYRITSEGKVVIGRMTLVR
jgi:hypothetical protein